MSYGCYSKGGTIYTRNEDDAVKVSALLSEVCIDNEIRPEPDTNVVEVYGSNCISYKEEDYEDIAKLAIKDSYISFIGEDDSVWTLKFEGGEVYDYTGEILWDHEECKVASQVSEFEGQIIDIFEDFLEEKGITFPNDERNLDEDPENAAIIYGSDYGALQSAIENLLENWGLIERAVSKS